MRGMGVDASTTCIGYSIWEDDELVLCNRLVPSDNCVDWCERIQDLSARVQSIITEYGIEKIVEEDVPLSKKQALTLVQLGAVKGMMLTIAHENNVLIEFQPVGTWRKDIGISCGDRDRASMKVKSIEKVNELFGLNLEIPLTRCGNYKDGTGIDDMADSVLVYASKIDKYKQKPVVKKTFGGGAK